MNAASRPRPAPWWLVVATIAVGVLLVAPFVAMVAQALSAGGDQIHQVLTGPLLPELVRNTVELTVIVTGAAAVIALAAAWCTERTNVPGRRLLAVVLLLPLAVPEFVAGYSWVSIAPQIQGLAGASFVMILAHYPLIYLPVAATLRRSDPNLDEVARSLGVSAWGRFRRVTLPQVKVPLIGGIMIVALHLLAEYGAFAELRFRTFATAIYTQYSVGYDAATASVLTLILCVIGVVLVAGDSRVTRGGHPGPESRRPPARADLAALRWPAAAALTLVCGLAVGVPLGSITYWMIRGSSTTLPQTSLLGAAGTSLALAAAGALGATVLAVPVAVMNQRHRGPISVGVQSTGFLLRALPGIAVGLTFVTVAVRYLHALYQSAPLLVVAYMVLFFPLALMAVRAAIARVPVELDDTARSLGARPAAVLRRVTLPLASPGLGAAAILVWLSVTTELTATLLLRPTGMQTLATQFWAYTTGVAYGAAAPYAAAMVAISAIPVLILTRLSTRNLAPVNP